MEFDIVQIIGTVGVPTALCFYVLHSVQKELKELNTSIQQLNYILRANYVRRAPLNYELSKVS